MRLQSPRYPPLTVEVLHFNSRVVDQNADRERHPPSVIRLSVCPSQPSAIIETSSESGIETRTMSVLRQLPRKSSIMSPVKPAAIIASRRTPSIAPRTKTD